MLSFHPSSMYGYTVHGKRFIVEATVTALATVGFSFAGEATTNSEVELTEATRSICFILCLQNLIYGISSGGKE